MLIIGALCWLVKSHGTPLAVIAGVAGLLMFAGSFVLEKTADVYLFLKSKGEDGFALIVENWGEREALDLRIVFPPGFPLNEHDRRDIPTVLMAGGRHEMRIPCGVPAGVRFDFAWSWRSAGRWRRTHCRRKVTVQP